MQSYNAFSQVDADSPNGRLTRRKVRASIVATLRPEGGSHMTDDPKPSEPKVPQLDAATLGPSSLASAPSAASRRDSSPSAST